MKQKQTPGSNRRPDSNDQNQCLSWISVIRLSFDQLLCQRPGFIHPKLAHMNQLRLSNLAGMPVEPSRSNQQRSWLQPAA